MIYLPNGCYFSEPLVRPANWKTVNASTKSKWFIFYRFWDPAVCGPNNKPVPKQVMIKGMNRCTDLEARRQMTAGLLKNELDLLKAKGWNPITGQFMASTEKTDHVIDPATGFIASLRSAAKRLTVAKETLKDINCVIRGVEKACMGLGMQNIPVSQVKRRHIKAILDRCEQINPRFTDNRYNLYKAYLQMLFSELVELETVEYNIMKDIKKKTVSRRKRPVLSVDQRQAIDKHLQEVFPRFRAFVHLFFHSGGRKTELLQLKPGDVDLEKQVYRTVIRKRKTPQTVERTIKTVAIPFWKEFLTGCQEDQYLFGREFKPGIQPMGNEMPTKYWKEYVKDGLGISIDFYPLKHLNTTEVTEKLDEQAAARLNGHTSTAMVRNIYDVGRDKREHEQLKNVDNLFA